jgi:hypothetical protein
MLEVVAIEKSFRWIGLTRIFYESAYGGPQGVGSEAYLNGTSQGPTREDAREDGHIRGRSS